MSEQFTADQSTGLPAAPSMDRKLRTPEEFARDMREAAPPMPTVAELGEVYSTPDQESIIYEDLIADAEDGKLGFDPVENVLDFAAAADARDPETGAFEITVPVDPNEDGDPHRLPRTAAQRLIQQAHFARSLGFQVGTDIERADGQVRLKVTSPDKVELPSYEPVRANGYIVDHAPVQDQAGETIPDEVMESLYARGAFIRQKHMLEKDGGTLKLTNLVRSVMDKAGRGDLQVDSDLAFLSGAASLDRNIAEGLGYQTGDVTPGESGSFRYKIELAGRRPGFEDVAATTPPAPSAARAVAPAETIKEVDPDFKRLIEDPDSLSADEHQRILDKVGQTSAWEATKNMVVVRGKDGGDYWGSEFPTAFAINGGLRGKFDRVPKDTDQWTQAMEVAKLGGERNMGGTFNTVIIELDNGETVLIRKTGGGISADGQTFEAVSTRPSGDQPITRKSIESSDLDGVVLVTGEPLVLNPKGKRRQSPGRVTRIIAIQEDDEGRVAANHPALQKPEKQRNDLQQFRDKITAAQSQ